MSRHHHTLSTLPALPTALNDTTRVDLAGYDLWFTFIENVHVIQGVLQLDSFQHSLSRTLQLYPHAAGHLYCENSSWNIRLANSPVPIEIEYNSNDNTASYIDGDWVIQNNLNPLLSQMSSDAVLVNGNAPLLRFKIVFFKDETSIGVSWHHTLGDATAMFRFMHTVSQLYQEKLPSFPDPLFKRHTFSQPSVSLAEEYGTFMPHLLDTYKFSELRAEYARVMDGVERLQYRFDRRQLEEIKTVVHNSAIEGARKTSTHDCLVAYLITVLNRCMENPIQRVTNVGSYRHVAASFIDPDFAGNAIHVIPSGTLPTDMAGISVAIRESIIRWRDPALLEKWLGTASHLMLEAANTGKAMFFAPREDVLTINSNVLIDWRTIHFGFEQFSSHFTAGVNKFYLRMHKSNPISGVQRFTRDGIDISLGIPRGMKQEVLDLVEGRF